MFISSKRDTIIRPRTIQYMITYFLHFTNDRIWQFILDKHCGVFAVVTN